MIVAYPKAPPLVHTNSGVPSPTSWMNCGDSLATLFRIACLHLSGRRYRDARRYAERLVLKAPRYPEVQRVLGDSCLGAHDLGRAKRAFNDLLQLRPGDVVAQQRVKFLDGTR